MSASKIITAYLTAYLDIIVGNTHIMDGHVSTNQHIKSHDTVTELTTIVVFDKYSIK